MPEQVLRMNALGFLLFCVMGCQLIDLKELFFMSKQQTLNIAFNNFSQPQS
jgi:hypothetical protein